MQLCCSKWEKGLDRIFDQAAGDEAAKERKRARDLNVRGCVGEFKAVRRLTER